MIKIPTLQDAVHVMNALSEQIEAGEVHLKPLYNNIAEQYNSLCSIKEDKYNLYE